MSLFSFAGIMFVGLGGTKLLEKIPKLPKDINKQIEELSHEPVPNCYLGETGFVKSSGLKIWYESIGDVTKPTVLLIMGHSTSGLSWTKNFIQPILDAGYHVIRFDNRDVGASEWTKEKYDLEDMATDGIAILDKLKVKAAHVIGISMGGMIGQHFSLNFPERTLSFTSIASTGFFFDPDLPSLTLPVIVNNALLIARYGFSPTGLIQKVKRRLGVVTYLSNTHHYSDELIAESVAKYRFEEQENRQNNPKAPKNHTRAIRQSGSRLDMLPNINAPVLVVHGTEDKLIQPEHGKKYAPLFKQKDEFWVEGMGHIPTKDEERLVSNKVVEFLSNNAPASSQPVVESVSN